jgi:hypothetical protein
VLATIFAAVAAIAALVAIQYARQTVTEARRANAESAKANAQAVEARGKQLAAMERATEATVAATEAAAEQYKLALAAELSFRRMEHLERLSGLLRTIADVARDESRNPPEKLAPGHTGSALPVLHRHLGNSVRIMQLVTGGSELPNVAAFARAGYTPGVPLNSLSGAVDGLLEIEALLLNDDEMDAVRFFLE